MTSTPNPKPQAPAHHAEPDPSVSEDSIPQDDGTDNRWQMEPLEKPDDEKAEK